MNQFCDLLFAERLRGHTVLGKPVFHLNDRIRVFQIRDVLHFGDELILGAPVHLNGCAGQSKVDFHAAVVNLLVNGVFVPENIRHRVIFEPLFDGKFHLDIALVVGLEGFPLVRCIRGKMSFSGLPVRHAEIADEVFTFFHLLILKAEYCTDTFQ